MGQYAMRSKRSDSAAKLLDTQSPKDFLEALSLIHAWCNQGNFLLTNNEHPEINLIVSDMRIG